MKNRRSQKTRNFDPVEYIVELLRENPLPEGTYSQPGAKFPVYAKAVREIVEQAEAFGNKCDVRVEPDPLLGTDLILEIRGDLVVFDDMKKFTKAADLALNLDISPLADGKVCVGFLFKDAFAVYLPGEPPRLLNKEALVPILSFADDE